ncbi:hypothetical protein SO802_009637 [Lithocarpus litseifolius]|uniref:DUF4283 domain-containing protein n=1 Tax=Lithocarpus litseifolius TaxID=425828 RepID=A0AAW2DFS4_9ROSI
MVERVEHLLDIDRGAWDINKVKEVHHGETVATPHESLTSAGTAFELRNDSPKPSFKEKLVEEIPGAFAQAFNLAERMEVEEEVEAAQEEEEEAIEPNFKPASVVVSSVAIWVRLNGLPIEYYDREVLMFFRQAIRNVLRIDTYTASEARGRYASLCI